MHDGRRARAFAYSVAVLAPVISLLIRWPLWPVLGDAVPHMTFFPAVMISAYLGGFWPGLLSTIISAVAANYFLTQQLPSFQAKSVNDVVALILFVMVGAIISALSESMHRARRRIVAYERRRAEELLRERMLNALPAAAYTCDAEGLITYVNERATELWGRSPKLNHPDDRFCGSSALFGSDGRAIPREQCWMAVAIQ